jgi:hypothetical protein
VTTTEFLDDARSAAKDIGMPGIRMVALPASTYYRARGSLKEVRPVAAAAIDALINGLTRPLTAEEASPKSLPKEVLARTIKVSGVDYTEAAEKVNQIFLENRWADGLPVVPPTERAVQSMLKGTTRFPAEVLGLVSPKNGTATIEKIAINAVMAGAKPEFLPVILAAMEGFLDPNYDLTHVQASTGSFVPAVIVTGPIAKELNFNSGIGLLGHGFRANSTIGRALRLSLLNLGQTWPAVNDMALVGRIAAYTFYTFAENQALSPWEPEHVAEGLNPEDSAVTVSTVGGQVTSLGGGAVEPWSAQGILDRIISNISRVSTSAGGVYAMKYIVVLHPDCATELAGMGYSRKSLREWIYENSRVPFSKLNPAAVKIVQRMIADGQFRPDHVDVFKDSLKEGGRIPVVQGPEDIHIFVSGGSPGYSLLMSYGGPNWAHQIRKIRGATLTKAGQSPSAGAVSTAREAKN